jgi:hypothetical protein
LYYIYEFDFIMTRLKILWFFFLCIKISHSVLFLAVQLTKSCMLNMKLRGMSILILHMLIYVLYSHFLCIIMFVPYIFCMIGEWNIRNRRWHFSRIWSQYAVFFMMGVHFNCLIFSYFKVSLCLYCNLL